MSTPRVRCHVCGFVHANPHLYGQPNYPTASESDLAASDLDPAKWVEVWERAADAFRAVSFASSEVEDAYKAAPPKDRKTLRVARDLSRLALCAAIANLWRLPHPSQIRQREALRAGKPFSYGCVG